MSSEDIVYFICSRDLLFVRKMKLNFVRGARRGAHSIFEFFFFNFLKNRRKVIFFELLEFILL